MTTTNVVADPAKPYKAYAAAAIAFLGLLWANLQGVKDWDTLGFQGWLTIIIPTIVTFGGTYLVENPKVAARRNERGSSSLLYILVAVVVLLLVLFVLVPALRR